jgi:hypothetical protein
MKPRRCVARGVMSDQQGVKLDANEHAARTVPKASAVSWPFPVDRRLDQLVDLANEAGANVRRNELVAAIVAAATADSDALLRMVIEWRRYKVREVVLDVDTAAQVVEIPRYKPGRRRGETG